MAKAATVPFMQARFPDTKETFCVTAISHEVVKLSRAYTARGGAPVIDAIDTGIFHHRYFSACLSCTFCGHSCCHWGVDVDAENVERIMARADEIEAHLGIGRERWFTGEWEEIPDYPGGRSTRTRVENGACVFQNRATGACRLHGYALDKGFDYHEIKPLISSLFPLSFGDGVLCLSEEILEGSLACMSTGPAIYDAQRNELLHYFGEDFLAEVDAVRAQHGLALTPA